MKISTFLTALTLLFSLASSAQNNTGGSWSAKYGHAKAFIENKGQFKPGDITTEPVLYAVDHGSTMAYFTSRGITYSFLKTWKKDEGDEKERRKEREHLTEKEYKKEEAEEHKLEFKTDQVSFEWENANPDVKIVAEEMLENYFSYTFKKNGQEQNENFIHGYKKITYKDLYPNIDVEYVFHPTEGLKYSVILHPGADPSLVKMKYASSEKLSFDHEDLVIRTKFGNIIDHAPVTFYEGNTSSIIGSRFEKEGNVISFKLGAYDNTKTVVIDPWTVTPAFATNWDCVWECERDGAGNVYIIGGVSPMQLLKYNSAGALQWTYSTPYDTTSWLGTFATDNAGNSYVTQGSTAKILKVNTTGGLVWSNASPGGAFGTTEFWSISFNCDESMLVIGGTGGGIPPKPYIYNVNTTTGNISSSVQVHGGGGFTGQEIRAITACGNGKYYYLSHDSIGFIDQSLSFCTSSAASAYHRNNQYTFGYKCENWRKDNTGICAIRANTNFVYTHKGSTVDKRSLTTANIITSAAIAGGAFTSSFGGNYVQNSGIDIDDCGNVYVGSKNSVVKYDANLVLLATYPVSFNVYDVHVTAGGNIIACGSTGDYNAAIRPGYIQYIAAAACAPLALTCCNPTICAPNSLCVSASPVTLQPATSGGTWSGTGVNASGVFSPSVAGAGTFVITYTLACGSSSVSITVNPCTALSVCQNSSPTTLTVSGGSGPYSWQQQVTTTPCISGFGVPCAGFGTVAGPPVTSWSTFATGTTITPPGTYPIQVVDNAGTVFLINSLGSVPSCTSCPPLTVTPASQVNVSCFGVSTGSFSASTSGGASPYDYTLMNGATTVATFTNIAGSQAFSGLAAGTYTLNVLDNNGCPGSTTITITQPASAAAVSITGTTAATCGATNGSATATASGGTGPYDYVWTGTAGTLQTTNNVAGPNTLSGLAAGTYTVTITDNNSCTSTTTATITSTGGATVSITAQTNVLCFGGTTGNATGTAAGGSSPYDYVWTGTSGTLQTTNNIAGSDILNGLAAGTYTVTVTDNAGCTGTATATITQPSTAASVAITGTTGTPCGGSTGTATAQASGGTSPYDYVWTGSSGTLQTTNNVTGADVLNGLSAGTYTVTITDNNGCISSATATVTSTGGATVSITAQTNVLCFGGATGTATATASGGTSPYDYAWTGAAGTLQTTNNIAGADILDSLAAGTYTVTVTDNSGCISNATVTITEPPAAASVAITGTTPAACGTASGSATAQASGGTGPYDYVWTGTAGTLQTTNNISGPDALGSVAAGTYTVTITDNNGCTSTTTASISNSGGATTNITASVNVSCFGGSNGSATANTTGGTAPYDYVWTGSAGTLQTTNDIVVPNTLSGLAAGTYTVTVTDNSGCVSNASITITQPASALTLVTASSANTSCGLNNGSASVSASGGTSGYTYSWAPTGGSSTSAGSLAGGTYTVTVTDANSCTATTTATVGASTGVTVAVASQTNVSCNGGTNGTATVTPSGGTGTYAYTWTGSTSTSATATGLAAGSYTVTAISGSCSNTTTVAITQPSAISATVNTTPATCTSPTGTATAAAGGGTGTLSYLWNNAATTSSITALNPGTVSVTVTDAAGCTQTASGSVGSTGGITASVSADVVITQGESTTLFATGGQTYTWSPATGLSCGTCDTTVATPLQSTTYCVTADSSSCTDTACVRVTVEIPCPTNKDLAVPNAFSPNDDGHNDIFCLQGWSNCIQTFNIYIFDRWGEKVFESADAGFCWDGTYRGKALDPAVFVYFITATFSNDNKVESKGNISLIR
ncbi:MAG: hypothetical protein JWO09_1917 [Bacteroidetes bacterium]|nr:hypothetical protein [Bacteroidota bacterium]